MRQLILLLLLLAFSPQLFAQGQTRTRKEVVRKYYLNGRIKSVTETRITLPKFIDPLNFYKKTKVIVTEYDSLSNNKSREFTRVTKLGRDGKPCYEIFFEEIRYDSTGARVTYTMSKCDKRKTMFKEYKGGKLVFTRIQKRRKRR